AEYTECPAGPGISKRRTRPIASASRFASATARLSALRMAGPMAHWWESTGTNVSPCELMARTSTGSEVTSAAIERVTARRARQNFSGDLSIQEGCGDSGE